MKKLFLTLLALCTLGSQVVVADTQAKEKKKKEVKWEWDGSKSGNETIDNYLVTVDAAYKNLQEYKNSIATYDFRTDTLEINGDYYVRAYMLNGDKQMVTRGTVNWQCVQALLNSTNIVLEMTNAGLGSANAALALPQLGLKAFSFGKYVKGGPVVIAEGVKTIKEIRATWIANSRNWKYLKEGAVEDLASLNYFSEEDIAKMKKCCYLKKIEKSDPAYQTIQETRQNKSKEELESDAQKAAKDFADANMAPEDKSKELDDVSDDALEKAMQG